MIKKGIVLALFFIVCNSLGYSQITKPVGINIASISDYSTELTFTDVFKQSRKWISSDASGGGAWDTDVIVPLNNNGYPLEIPYDNGVNPPQLLKTLMLWDIGSAVPQGQYRLKVTGQGQVRLSFGASGTYDCPIDILVDVTGQVMLEITQSNSANPIEDIKFILPDYIDTYDTQIFTTEFLDFLEDFQVIRFMDFTRTNASPVVSWEDRTSLNYYTQAKQEGAAWEYVIEIANQTQKDIWINIPHKADDNFITELATLLQDNLDPNINIYLEYSNELWNGAFSQNADCAAFAEDLGYTGQPWERTWKYTAKRSADVFKIFENVITNDQRLVKVIPSQAANSWLTNEIITYFNDPFYNPTLVTANAVAIAPYFGNEVADEIASNGETATITTPEILQMLQNSMNNNSFQWMINNKEVADNYGLNLICYEGGQHLVATGNNMNDATLTTKLIATNHDSGMHDLYCEYLNYWYETVGTLFCHFSSHGSYSQYGSWGVKENFQDVSNPKYLALQNCVFDDNVLFIDDIDGLENEILFYPNPISDFITVVNPGISCMYFEYEVRDLTSRLIQTGRGYYNIPLSINAASDGIYILSISDKELMKSVTFIKE